MKRIAILALVGACGSGGGSTSSSSQAVARAACAGLPYGGDGYGCGSGSGAPDAGVDAGSGRGSGILDAALDALDAGSDAGWGSGSDGGIVVADDAVVIGFDAGSGSGGSDAGWNWPDAGTGGGSDAPWSWPDAGSSWPDAGSGSDAPWSDAPVDGPPPCIGVYLEDCHNVLQVYEETVSADRPSPSCTAIAQWLAADAWQPGALSLGGYALQSGEHPDDAAIDPSQLRSYLFSGTLAGFQLVSLATDQQVCSFVSSWNEPLKQRWVVEAPPRSPPSSSIAPDLCDNGWGTDLTGCALDEEMSLQEAPPGPPPETGVDAPDPDYTVTTDQP